MLTGARTWSRAADALGTPAWSLLGLSVVVVVLWAAGVLPDWPGLVHLVALPPLGLFTDLRILVSLAPSYPVFALGLVLSVTARVLLLALLMGGLDRSRIAFAFRYHLVALPFGLLGAAVLFASPATLYYGLFWIGFAVVLLPFVLLAALPWQDTLSLWGALGRSLRQGARAGTVLAYIALLSLVGVAADFAGPAAMPLLVVVSAALTFAAVGVLGTREALRVPRRALAAVVTGLLLVPLVVVMAGPSAPPEDPAPGPAQPGSVLIMSGVDSASGQGAIFEIDPGQLGYTCEQTFYYSYTGPGDGVEQGEAFCSIRTGAPYEEQDTLRGSNDLVPFFHQQVAELPPPVLVLAHSQAVWITWLALAEGNAHEAVSQVALVGPFPENPVSYPPDRESRPGRVGTDVVFAVANLARPGGTSEFHPQDPLAREFLAAPAGIRRVMDMPLPPHVQALSVPSVFDLPLMPHDWRVNGAVNACPVPVMHPNLPYADELLENIKRYINAEPLGPCPPWRTALGPVTRSFTVPPN